MPNDYLFTWNPKRWPYSNLRVLIDEFEAGKSVTAPWRCLAHRTARPGDSAYFLKLGDHPQGIFGVGTIISPAIKTSGAQPGQNAWEIPISFRDLVDPTRRRLLVSDEQLATIAVPTHTWHPQGSGVRLAQEAARKIDEIIETTKPFLSTDAADSADFDALNIEDAREKINRSIALRRGQRAFRAKLLTAYDRKCAVTGCGIEDLLEAAHIVPYQGLQTNHIQNGLLLRSDIHTLFDCGLIAIDPVSRSLILSPRLSQGSYRNLSVRKIRFPRDPGQMPSNEALRKHRLSTGL